MYRLPRELYHRGMGDAVLADPQGQTQLPPVAGFGLSEAFKNALEMETTSPWLEPRRLEEILRVVAPHPGWTASQEVAPRAAVASQYRYRGYLRAAPNWRECYWCS
jgi:hypothetical protein